MPLLGIRRPNSRSFTSTIVDLVVRPDVTVKGNDMPRIVEIQAYLRSLDTVILAYHHKRDKVTAKFDHLYIVFRTSVQADNFMDMWLFWENNHFMKANYDARQDSEFPSLVLHHLQQEMERIPRIAGSISAEEPTRFKGFAFTRIGPDGLGTSPSPASLEARCDFLKRTILDQEVDLIVLEEMVKTVREDYEKRLKENAELKVQLTRYREIWRQVNNVEKAETVSGSRK